MLLFWLVVCGFVLVMVYCVWVMICYIAITIGGDLFVGWFIVWCYGLGLLFCDCLGVGFGVVD